jgi:hypothetical protein
MTTAAEMSWDDIKALFGVTQIFGLAVANFRALAASIRFAPGRTGDFK